MGCRDISLDDIMPQFWLSGSETDFLAELQREDRNIIGLFPGASVGGRQWSPVNYGELAGMLPNNIIYVLFGSADEEKLCKDVVASITERCSDATIINLSGKTTLRQLVKTISSCDLFIGMETSGLHIAIATGIPSIGIVGGGHFGRFVPWGDTGRSIFLTNQMECFHCNWSCRNNKMECISGVSPYEVAESAKILLGI
jgi:ADP-heptose:LPS heptosyltransferase